MNSRLRKYELCPLHHSRNCCGRESRPLRSSFRNSARGDGNDSRPQRSSFTPPVQRIDDPHSPRGYREIRNDKAKRELKHRHLGEQRSICPLCLELIQEYRDAELCHKKSCGMGGAQRDDSHENTFAGHRWCNREMGSRPFVEGMLARTPEEKAAEEERRGRIA